VDSWAGRQPEPKPSRSEALRLLVEKGLASEAPPISATSLERQIADQEVTIAEMPEPEGPSPEAAMATMDRAIAKNDLIDMENRRAHRRGASRGPQKP